MTSSHTGMFRPAQFYGEPHAGNCALSTHSFYFTVRGSGGIGGVGGYVTREQFNWLAECLGLAPLPDEHVPEAK